MNFYKCKTKYCDYNHRQLLSVECLPAGLRIERLSLVNSFHKMPQHLEAKVNSIIEQYEDGVGEIEVVFGRDEIEFFLELQAKLQSRELDYS